MKNHRKDSNTETIKNTHQNTNAIETNARRFFISAFFIAGRCPLPACLDVYEQYISETCGLNFIMIFSLQYRAFN